MAPTPEQYKAALDALRDDATQWEACANDLVAAKTTADDLDLQALHFSYVADKLGVTQLYTDFQNRMTRVLGEGDVMCRGVAESLRKAAQTYQEEEEAGVHRMNGIW